MIKLKKEQEKFNRENNYMYGNMNDYYFPQSDNNVYYEYYGNDNDYNYYQNQYEHPFDNFENDIEKAKELSLNQHYKDLEKKLPKEPIKGYTININYKGKILSRKFSETDTIGDIKNYIKCQLKTNEKIEIYQLQPRKHYEKDNMTLLEAGLGYNQMLVVSI